VYDKQLREVADDYKSKGIISEYDEYCPNMDSAQEVAMFETCISKKYDIILINAGGSSGLDSCFEEAEKAGILVVPVDNLYPWAGSIGVQTDQTIWAGNSCKAMCEALGGKGNILCFHGQMGATGAGIRGDVWNKILAGYPDIKIVYEGAHNWSQTESKKLMAQVLATGVKYDAILTEEACVGILEAIEEAGAEYPKFMTSDEEVGYLRMLNKINKDKTVVDFYIIENPPGIGASALKAAVRMRAGWKYKDGILKDGTSQNKVLYYTPKFIVTPDGHEGVSLKEAIDKTANMEDTDQVSAYFSEEAIDGMFQ